MARLLATLFVAAAAVAFAAPAQASGFLVPTDRVAKPRRCWSIESYKVHVTARGPHARVTVDQVFKNVSPATLQADYVFPLPKGAMVSSVTLYDGVKAIEGTLLRADDARRAYLDIVRRRKDPALLEYLGRDLFRVRVFPIPPGQVRRVVLSYDHVLSADSGLVEFVHPLSTVRLAGHAAKVSMRIGLEAKGALGPIYSPTHDIEVVRAAKNKAHIRFDGDVHARQADLQVFWSTTTRDIGATLLTYWPSHEERGYFLLLATPSPRLRANERTRFKSITFVVDTSGSMSGEKIEQVRAALLQVIPALNTSDRFNVISYASAVVPLWSQPMPVDAKRRAQALAFVEGLQATGGTNIQGALAAALNGPREEGMPSVVVFLTDGRPTVGERDPAKILAAVKKQNPDGKQRVFVLGVGVDVNTVLLDRLALENRGAPAFVRPRENVEVKVSGLYDKIRYPVLTGVRLEAVGMMISETLPAQLPDLFRGSELVVAGRYRRGGSIRVMLAGRDGAVEREHHYVLSAARKGAGLTSDFPARVWATRRIAQLLDEVRLHRKKDPELINEIVRLSTKFGILTEYTSFLADETGVSHAALDVNARRTRKIVDALAERAVGGTGLAQSANQASRRGAQRAPSSAGGYYLGAAGDRDVERVQLHGVRQVANQTFFYRGAGVGWVDGRVPETRKPDISVVRWSPAFFDLLEKTSPDENARLSQEGPLLLLVQGRVVKVVDG